MVLVADYHDDNDSMYCQCEDVPIRRHRAATLHHVCDFIVSSRVRSYLREELARS